MPAPPALTIPIESIHWTSSYVKDPPTDKLPATFKLLAIPTPPLITNEPSPLLVDAVVSVILTIPVLVTAAPIIPFAVILLPVERPETLNAVVANETDEPAARVVSPVTV